MNDDLAAFLDALADCKPGDPLPEMPAQPPEEQLVNEWGMEYAQLTAEHAADLFNMRFDEARRARIAELHAILTSAGDDD